VVELELWSPWEGKKNREDRVMSIYIYTNCIPKTVLIGTTIAHNKIGHITNNLAKYVCHTLF